MIQFCFFSCKAKPSLWLYIYISAVMDLQNDGYLPSIMLPGKSYVSDTYTISSRHVVQSDGVSGFLGL